MRHIFSPPQSGKEQAQRLINGLVEQYGSIEAVQRALANVDGASGDPPIAPVEDPEKVVPDLPVAPARLNRHARRAQEARERKYLKRMAKERMAKP